MGRDVGEREYSRRLRRYEAEPIVQRRVAGPSGAGMDLYSPFGPLVAKVRVSPSLLERLNRFADEAVERHARAGAVEPLGELTVPEGVASEGGTDSLAASTARCIRSYLEAVDDRSVDRVRFEMFWIVRHLANAFSPVHFHTGDISGVMYLRVPDHIENEAEESSKTYISARRAGYITFFIGGKQQYSKSLISFKPEVGDLYLFPGWLLHAVEPFGGEGERRSLAFNAFVG